MSGLSAAREPAKCRIVLYKLTHDDVAHVAQRLWPANGREGLIPDAGDEFPMMITSVTDGANMEKLVNGQCFLDGPFTLWLNFIKQGTAPGSWRWPT